MAPQRQSLGRGLDQLLGRTQDQKNQKETSSKNKVFNISIEKIQPDRGQPRKFFDEKSLEELAQSMKEQGLIQPVIVSLNESGAYTLLAGERRWRAAQKIGWTHIPAILKTKKDEVDKMTLALVENIQRQDLNPLEEARAFLWFLKEKNWSQQTLADKIGRDRSSVTNTLRLLNLHPQVQDLLLKNKISISVAKLLLQEKSLEKQKILARLAAQNSLTVKELENKLKDKIPSVFKKRQKLKEAPLWLGSACDLLSKKFNLQIQLKISSKKSSLTISFTDPEQLREFVDYVGS